MHPIAVVTMEVPQWENMVLTSGASGVLTK